MASTYGNIPQFKNNGQFKMVSYSLRWIPWETMESQLWVALLIVAAVDGSTPWTTIMVSPHVIGKYDLKSVTWWHTKSYIITADYIHTFSQLYIITNGKWHHKRDF